MVCQANRILFFCLPKAFEGHFGVIQRNALRSWKALSFPVLVLGDDEGVRETAEALGCQWRGGVKTNQRGTPLLDSAFGIAREEAERQGLEGLCYLNSDIIISDDFLQAWQRCRQRWRKFLLVGRRWNWDIAEDLEFDKEPAWQEALRARVQREGQLYNEWNIDFFCFSRELVRGMPPFAVGRPAWDNWMIYEARRRGYAVVDATEEMMAIHQNHDYSHTAEGRGGGVMAVWRGEEAEENRRLVGAHWKLLSLADATHALKAKEICRLRSKPLWRRRLEDWQRQHPRLAPILDWV